MKNSLWREYQSGVRRLVELEKRLGRTLEERTGRALPHHDRLSWFCAWCGTSNVIGEALCNKCHMPKLE